MEQALYRVYQVSNTVNEKLYVGITKRSMMTRWSSHISASKHRKVNFPLLNAIRKYGADKFKPEVICYCDGVANANFLEMHFIEKLDSYRHGYNGTVGGPASDHLPEDELRKANSQRMKGNQFAKGYKHTVEAKKFFSEFHKGNQNGLGWHPSDEQRKKMSDRGSERWKTFQFSDEVRKKLSDKAKLQWKKNKADKTFKHPRSGAKLSVETKAKISKSVSKAILGNKYALGTVHSEERRANHSTIIQLNCIIKRNGV